MKATYDRRTDTLGILLKAGSPIAESDELRPGVIIDDDSVGNLISLEILDASHKVTEAWRLEIEMTE